MISKEAKIGISTTIALFLFIWGISFLKNKNILTPTHGYNAIYSSVDGIKLSTMIYINGYEIGSVKDIHMIPGDPVMFNVEFITTKGIKVPKGSIASIKDADIMGTKAIELILPGKLSGEYHQPGDTLISNIEKGLAGIIETLETQLNDITQGLSSVVNKIDSTLNGQLIADLNSTVSNVEDISGSLKHQLNGSIKSTIENIQSITGAVSEQTDTLSNIIANINGVTNAVANAPIDSMIYNMEQISQNLNTVSTHIADQKGSVGKMIYSDSLYYNINTSILSLDTLLTDLQKNPKRYVHLSLFGGKE